MRAARAVRSSAHEYIGFASVAPASSARLVVYTSATTLARCTVRRTRQVAADRSSAAVDGDPIGTGWPAAPPRLRTGPSPLRRQLSNARAHSVHDSSTDQATGQRRPRTREYSKVISRRLVPAPTLRDRSAFSAAAHDAAGERERAQARTQRPAPIRIPMPLRDRVFWLDRAPMGCRLIQGHV